MPTLEMLTNTSVVEVQAMPQRIYTWWISIR